MNARSVLVTVGIVAIAAAIVFFLLQNNPPPPVAKAPGQDAAIVELSVELKTTAQKASYGFGAQMALRIKEAFQDYDTDAVALAVKDVLGGEPRLTRSEMRDAVRAYTREKIKQRKEQGEKAKRDGEKFLAENKNKEGIQTTESGLQYQVIKQGSGEHPSPSQSVKVNYKGTLINGEVFDSSYDRGEPAKFRLDRIIKGWTEGIQLMKPGATYKFFIPSALAYGVRGSGVKIPPNSVLVFEVQLLESFNTEAATASPSTPAHAHGNAEKDGESKTEQVNAAAGETAQDKDEGDDAKPDEGDAANKEAVPQAHGHGQP